MRKNLVSLCVFSFVFCIFSLCGCGQVNSMELAIREGNAYNIEAILDFDNKTLEANQTLTYHNKTGAELEEIKFHLYPNAFRADCQSCKAVSDTQFSRAYPQGFNEGGIDIKSTKCNNTASEFVLEGEDDNILSIKCVSTIKPNAIVDINICFSLTIPICNHRFGAGSDTLNLGNWYPVVCVFEDGHFLTNGYHTNGDPFYSEVANYIVKITYAKTLTMASTGRVIDTEVSGNNKIDVMHGEAVRDFAMIFSPKYQVANAMADDIAVEYYYYDDADYLKNLQTAVDSILTFNKLFGKYPYSVIRVAKADFLQGGMEYPMLVYISDEVDKADDYRNVIVHELAHQWWYGVVGNNECEYAWLDEGLAEYSTALFYEYNQQYGRTYQQIIGTAISSYMLFCDVYREVYDNLDTSMNRSIYNFNTEIEYTYLTYVKGVLMFDSIQDMIGESKMLAGLKDYYADLSFCVARPVDLITSLEHASHKKLSAYIMSWLDGSVVFEELNN